MLRRLALPTSLLVLFAHAASANLLSDVQSTTPTATASSENVQDKKDPDAALTNAQRAAIENQKLAVYDSERGSQLICRSEKMTGSRIKRRRCLSLAAWRREFEIRMIRTGLVTMAGREPGW